jgi:class 3 adenylate cyclase/tetratricopeptide (TPR) repeat protein
MGDSGSAWKDRPVLTCTACGAVNPAEHRFCSECGAGLAVSCPACGALAGSGFRFCGLCGADLSAPPPAGSAPADPGASAGPVAERRLCSVLFADLVGFTPLSESRDPEEVRELLSRYFDTARTVISRYGGMVEKFIGDAVMAVWGAPVAVEGDAERAVRAGIELVAAVAALGEEIGATGLALRAGVVTGEVAVSVGAVGEGMVAGDAVNTAARVQAAAAAGTVWVDAATQRLSAAGVGFVDVGEHLFKGKTEPARLWQATRVLSSVGGQQRVDGLEAQLIGRDAELRTIKELFHACADRRIPRLLVISGAAGVGKSRLGWEFEKYADGLADALFWHRGQCLFYGDGVAYRALAEMVRQRFGVAEEDSVDVAAEKFLEQLPQFVPDEQQRSFVGVRLGRLLGITHPDDVDAPLNREDLFAGWRLFFERLADTQPVVLLVEDAQHADDTLLDFVDHLLDWARTAPIFVLLFTRPELLERRPELGTGRNRTSMALDPLDPRSMQHLVGELVPDMPPAAVTAIAEQAQGNPLFAVETVRSLIDRDVVMAVGGSYRLVGDIGVLSVPDSLHGLLAARLDALDPRLRSLVADAAVLGTSFPAEALAVVAGRTPEDVSDCLAELVRRGVLELVADPLSPQRGSYEFCHDMLRQVAYETLSRRDRKARHLAVAGRLEKAFADSSDEIMDVIAQHYLDALSAVPDDTDVPQIRTQAVTSLVRAAERAERAGAPKLAAQSAARAAGLCPQDSVEAGQLWERAARSAEVSRTFDDGLRYVTRARECYGATGDDRAAARCLARSGRILRLLGRLSEARTVLADALQTLRPDPDVDTVWALTEASTVDVFTGGSRGRALADEALELGQAIGVPDVLLAEMFVAQGIADFFVGRLAQATAALEYATEVAERGGHSEIQGRALLNLSAVLVSIDATHAAEVAVSACELCRRTGARVSLGFAVSNLATAYLGTGQWDEAAAALDEAMEVDGLDDEYVLALRGMVEALRGDETAARRYSELPNLRRSDDLQDAGMVAWVDAFLAAAAGLPAEALAQARNVISRKNDIDATHEAFFWTWPLAVRAAFELHDLDTVRELVALVEADPLGRRPALIRAEVALAHARLAAAEGPADEEFAAAVGALRAVNSPYHLAHGLLDWAEHRSGSGAGAAEAADLVTEAVAIAEQLGAAPLLARAGGLASVG